MSESFELKACVNSQSMHTLCSSSVHHICYHILWLTWHVGQVSLSEGKWKLKFTNLLGKWILIFFFLPWHGLQENLSIYLLIFIWYSFTVLPTNKTLKGWQHFLSVAISSIYFSNVSVENAQKWTTIHVKYSLWKQGPKTYKELFLLTRNNSATGLRTRNK